MARFGISLLVLALALAVSATHRNQREELRRRHHRHHHHNATGAPPSAAPETPTGTWAPFYNVTDQPSGSTGAFDAEKDSLRRGHHRHHHHNATDVPPSAAPEILTGTWAPQPNATYPPSGPTGAFDAENDSLRRGHHRHHHHASTDAGTPGWQYNASTPAWPQVGSTGSFDAEKDALRRRHHRHHHHNTTGAPESATPEAPTGTWAPFYNVTDEPSGSTSFFNAEKEDPRHRHHRHHHHNATSEPVSATPEGHTGTWAPFYNVTDQPSGSTGSFNAENEEARRRHHRHHHHSTDAGTPGWQYNASTPAWPQEGSTGAFDAEKEALRRGHHHHHNSTGSPDASTPAWQPEPSTGDFDAQKDELRRGHHRHHHHASTDAGTPAWQFNATTPNAPSWPPQQGSTGAFSAAELRRKHHRHHHHNATSVPPTPGPVVDSTPW